MVVNDCSVHTACHGDSRPPPTTVGRPMQATWSFLLTLVAKGLL